MIRDARVVATAASTRRERTAWVERLVCGPGDDEDSRHRKIQFTIATVLVTPAGLVWGALYFAYGAGAVAIIPFTYSLLTVLDFLLLIGLRRYELFRLTQQFLLLILPVTLHLSLGGFVGSSLSILWSFLAVLTAVLFGGAREARWWFAAYVLALVLVAVVQPQLGIHNTLPHWLVLAFLVLNVVSVSSLAFVVLQSFVQDRHKLRALEVAYLRQDLMLRQSERLATVGTLAAGVVHELNNPAAATRRAAEQLSDAIARIEQARLALGEATLSPAARQLLLSLEAQGRGSAAKPADMDALTRADREEAIETWLERHRVPNPWELAAPLAAQGIDPNALDGLSAHLDNDALSTVLLWTSSNFRVHTLLHEIGLGSARTSEIVSALRSYSYLGQAPLQAVDLHEGLDTTLVMLRGKLTDSITVRREYAADVPRVQAFGRELNQVWTNLLTNAADAVSDGGVIVIRTRCDAAWAIVEIEDDGPGIPHDIQSKVFDPFFTTKAPGKGTGLGLSTSYSIITGRHQGTITMESRPGCTRFTVRLPRDASSSVVPIEFT